MTTTMTTAINKNSVQSTRLCRRNGAMHWAMMLAVVLLLLSTQQATMAQTPAPSVSSTAVGQSSPVPFSTPPPTPTTPSAPSTPVAAPVAPPVAPSTSAPVIPSSSSQAPTAGTGLPVGSPSPVPTPPTSGTPVAPATGATFVPTASSGTARPTATQTQRVTPSPSITPVSTGAPTATPVTAAPSRSTPKPTAVSTGKPTMATPAPTPLPTATPVTPPPTPSPTLKATALPTEKVTSSPTLTPTVHPSHSPSLKPTHVGSTHKPTVPTHTPSSFPSSAPSHLTDAYFKDVNMTLYGLASFPGSAQSSWITTTEKYIEDYFKTKPGLQVTVNHVILTIQSSTVVFSNGRERRLSRGLQSGTPSVIVTYNQEFGFKSPNINFDPAYVVTQPFADTRTYAGILSRSDQTAFSGLTGVSAVQLSGGPSSIVGGSNNSGGLSKLAVIIIGAGAGVLGLALLVALFYYMSSQRGRRLRRGYLAKKDNDDSPPTQLQLGTGADEVSTLAEPLPQTKMGRIGGAHESIAGYGDQSVTTVDYDYSKAYGGAGDTSVSSAGGTFGSNTQQNVEVTAAAAAAGAALGNSFSDADSFDANYREPGANIKEELIDIYAPPGKLGVVIDTPDDGAPVVHAIKDSSVIADKLQVGDKLVAVDDEDVRSMTAIKVSKLISRKSSNPTRKLSILRTTISD